MIAPDLEVYRYRSTYLNEVALHHHDFYEVYLLLRGRVAYTVENRIYQVRPGDIMLISPLELHQARISTDAEPYERIVLWVARSYLESLSSARTSLTRCFDSSQPGHSNLLRPSPQVSSDFRRRLELLGSLHGRQEYGSDLLSKCCLVELLVELNRAVAEAAA
ncbi:MAG TPA: AraC family ligand binding domain-containing protein, partial [Candidatus Gemmiger faecigallinarum]|nr:AraC family ligand binding domain-containing protein [Candidatus Gemmiger faecigallinarum]